VNGGGCDTNVLLKRGEMAALSVDERKGGCF